MSKSFQFSLVIKGIAFASLLALILALGFGFLLSLTSLPESNLAINVIVIISIFIPAFLAANRAGTRGLLYGLFIGLGFILLLLTLTGVFLDTSPALLRIGEKTIFALVAGGAGGIMGVLLRR
ncbi:MAG: TIGR04086 family membrane protein [Desulfitobacteriaceae bacterium]